jgi:5'-methylthioinosine phosphorylase
MQTLGVIGGSGLDCWGEEGVSHIATTAFGDPSGPITILGRSDRRMLFLPRHGSDHLIPPHLVNYRANLWALREAGADCVIAVNAVGGITQAFAPGALVLPDQLIDYSWGRAHSFSDGVAAPLQHVDFTLPFTSRLVDEVERAAARAGAPIVRGACLGVTQGPRLETAAEVDRLRRDGCDLVGMTSMPEAGLARELGLDYASICVVSNWAAGIADGPLVTADIDACLARTMHAVRAIITALRA